MVGIPGEELVKEGRQAIYADVVEKGVLCVKYLQLVIAKMIGLRLRGGLPIATRHQGFPATDKIDQVVVFLYILKPAPSDEMDFITRLNISLTNLVHCKIIASSVCSIVDVSSSPHFSV